MADFFTRSYMYVIIKTINCQYVFPPYYYKIINYQLIFLDMNILYGDVTTNG